MKEGRVAFVNTTQKKKEKKNKNKNAFGRIEIQYVQRNGWCFWMSVL